MEWGVGDGTHAADFLNHFQQLDTATRFYPRLQYTLADFSPEMLQHAQNNEKLKPHAEQLIFNRFDALDKLPWQHNSVHLIHVHELYDDLGNVEKITKTGPHTFSRTMARVYIDATKHFQKIDGTSVDAKEVARRIHQRDYNFLKQLSSDFLADVHIEEQESFLDITNHPYREFLEHWTKKFPNGTTFPLNIGAAENLQAAVRLLNLENGGYLHVSDYGFTGDSFLETHQSKEGILFGKIACGQPTSFVNFELLTYVLSLQSQVTGFCERDHAYMSRIAGKNMRRSTYILQASTDFIHRMRPDLGPDDIIDINSLDDMNLLKWIALIVSQMTKEEWINKVQLWEMINDHVPDDDFVRGMVNAAINYLFETNTYEGHTEHHLTVERRHTLRDKAK